MATQYGYAVRSWLLERGWLPDDTPPEADWFGDAEVIDPITNERTNVYQAANLQRIRTGEYPEFLTVVPEVASDEPFLGEKLIDFSTPIPCLIRFSIIALVGGALLCLLALACG